MSRTRIRRVSPLEKVARKHRARPNSIIKRVRGDNHKDRKSVKGIEGKVVASASDTSNLTFTRSIKGILDGNLLKQQETTRPEEKTGKKIPKHRVWEPTKNLTMLKKLELAIR